MHVNTTILYISDIFHAVFKTPYFLHKSWCHVVTTGYWSLWTDMEGRSSKRLLDQNVRPWFDDGYGRGSHLPLLQERAPGNPRTLSPHIPHCEGSRNHPIFYIQSVTSYHLFRWSLIICAKFYFLFLSLKQANYLQKPFTYIHRFLC